MENTLIWKISEFSNDTISAQMVSLQETPDIEGLRKMLGVLSATLIFRFGHRFCVLFCNKWWRFRRGIFLSLVGWGSHVNWRLWARWCPEMRSTSITLCVTSGRRWRHWRPSIGGSRDHWRKMIIQLLCTIFSRIVHHHSGVPRSHTSHTCDLGMFDIGLSQGLGSGTSAWPTFACKLGESLMWVFIDEPFRFDFPSLHRFFLFLFNDFRFNDFFDAFLGWTADTKQ